MSTFTAYVSFIAGGYPTSSNRDGTGTNVYFNSPLPVAVSSVGDAYVVDYGKYVLRRINATGKGVISFLNRFW
jgi:hypothetical protein